MFNKTVLFKLRFCTAYFWLYMRNLHLKLMAHFKEFKCMFHIELCILTPTIIIYLRCRVNYSQSLFFEFKTGSRVAFLGVSKCGILGYVYSFAFFLHDSV